MEDLLDFYRTQCKLHRKYAYKILLDVKALFESQPSLVDVTIPDDSKFTICGDIHGQFYDLLHIFELNGLPSETNPYVSFYNCYLIKFKIQNNSRNKSYEILLRNACLLKQPEIVLEF